ncbi:MAG: uracil-DNA glycosylase [Nitrospina sp.]|nr:uracil-DNA glycosylase [Nitrospina sp.]
MSTSERPVILRNLRNYLTFLKDYGFSGIPSDSDIVLKLQPNTNKATLSTSNNEGPTKMKATKSITKKINISIEKVREALGDCNRCDLHKNRKTIVFGSGNPHAELVFVGEAPGADEDEQGFPFVGRAGKKLTEIIEKGMNLDREKDTYICNIVKCRPPSNRDPKSNEIESCNPFLIKQLQAIKPKAIVALGKPAASTLLGRTVPIMKERGNWYQYEGIPLMLTLHPAYLLRAYTLENRRNVMSDMHKVLAKLKE